MSKLAQLIAAAWAFLALCFLAPQAEAHYFAGATLRCSHSSANPYPQLQARVLFWQTVTAGTAASVEGGVQISGIDANSSDVELALHIHLFGDLTSVLDSDNGANNQAIATTAPQGVGPHFNPENQLHDCYTDVNRHAGDIGNVTISQGKRVNDTTLFMFSTDQLALIQLSPSAGPNNSTHGIIGRAVVIHSGGDKCRAYPGNTANGNAGSAIAQGVVGVVNPSSSSSFLTAFTGVPTSGGDTLSDNDADYSSVTYPQANPIAGQPFEASSASASSGVAVLYKTSQYYSKLGKSVSSSAKIGEEVAGVVRFSAVKQAQLTNDAGQNNLHIYGIVTGLKPLQEYGFHIHMWGDDSDSVATPWASASPPPAAVLTASHFNPLSGTHSNSTTDDSRHVGDLGNLVTDENGVAVYDNIIDLAPLGYNGSDAHMSIIGRAIVVHALQDISQGTAGNNNANYTKIMVGVIGYSGQTLYTNPFSFAASSSSSSSSTGDNAAPSQHSFSYISFVIALIISTLFLSF